MLALPVDITLLALPAVWSPSHWRALLVFTAVTVVFLKGAGRYRARLHVSVLDELPSLVSSVLLAAAVVCTISSLRHPSADSDGLLRAVSASLAVLLVGRVVVNLVILKARRSGLVAHPTIVIGTGPLGLELARLLSAYRLYGLRVIGFVDDRNRIAQCDASEGKAGYLGRLADLDSIAAAAGVQVLLLADPDVAEGALLYPLRGRHAGRCDLLVVPRLQDFSTQAGLTDHIGAIPVMRVRHPSMNGAAWVVKRFLDVVLSATAMFVFSPVLIACALAVRFFDGPGVLFRQQRLTRDGRTFDLIKFRSMRPESENESSTQWTIATDQRVSSVGRILRRTSLDELPQLWNILRGDMTVVGPRPERPYFVEKFSAEHPRYMDRHRVPCGLTGLAQVSGLRGDTSIVDRARYDNFYIENWSLWLDVKVILRTVREVVGARGR